MRRGGPTRHSRCMVTRAGIAMATHQAVLCRGDVVLAGEGGGGAGIAPYKLTLNRVEPLH